MNPYQYKELNKFKEWGEGIALAYRTINEFRIKKEDRTSSFGKYHHNNYYWNLPKMHADISEWTFEEN